MLTEDIVLLIRKIRKGKNISQKVLGMRVCSEQQISKIEKGETVPDFFLIEILFQRLGMTTDKLEILLSEEEFEEIRMRDNIVDDLRCGRIKKAKSRLRQFWLIMNSDVDCKGNGIVRQMNGYRLQGIYALETESYSEAEKNLRRAVELSMGKVESIDFSYILFGELELENLILLAHVWQRLEKVEDADRLLGELYGYIRRMVTDEEQLAKFLPKLAVVYGDICKSLGRKEEDSEIYREALELLRKHGKLQNMTFLLENLADDCKRRGLTEEADRYKGWKDAIEQLYSHFALDVRIVNKLYFNSRIGQYYLTGEVIKEERLAKKMSQEQLIEGIYKNSESLSRLENGKNAIRKSFCS